MDYDIYTQIRTVQGETARELASNNDHNVIVKIIPKSKKKHCSFCKKKGRWHWCAGWRTQGQCGGAAGLGKGHHFDSQLPRSFIITNHALGHNFKACISTK